MSHDGRSIEGQRKREWHSPVLTRHASLTVLTQSASVGYFSLLFQNQSCFDSTGQPYPCDQIPPGGS